MNPHLRHTLHDPKKHSSHSSLTFDLADALIMFMPIVMVVIPIIAILIISK